MRFGVLLVRLQKLKNQKIKMTSVRACQTETLVVLSVLLVTQVLLRSECELTQHLSWVYDGILCFVY